MGNDITAAQPPPQPSVSGVVKPLFDADPADPRPSFGNMIRGARLGFHWSEPLKAMVRIDAEGPPWKVTMCPPGKIPNSGPKTGTGRFLAWWEVADNPLAYSRAINVEANPREVVTFSINESGEKV